MGKQLRFILDTSALISLEAIGLADKVLDKFKTLITESVLKELETFSRHDDKYGLICRRLLSNKHKLKIEKSIEKEILVNLEPTDNDLYNLSKKINIPVITDDIRFSNITKGKIETMFSTFFLGFFISARIITKQNALEKLEKLRDIRNWQNNIIYLVTKEEIEKVAD